MQQIVDRRHLRTLHRCGVIWLCTLALACNTPSESVEGATADALTVEDTNGGDTSSGTADAAQPDTTLNAADSEDATTLPPTCSGSGSKLSCSSSPTSDGVFILHGDAEIPSFLPFAATLLAGGSVVVVGRGAIDKQDPLVDSTRSTGLVHDGSIDLRVHAPIVSKEKKKWLTGNFGESPKRVALVGIADQVVFTTCMEGYHTLAQTSRGYPCWVEWLPDPLAASIWSLFHIGKDSFNIESTTHGLLTNGTIEVSLADDNTGSNNSILVEYNTVGWADSLVGFWALEDESDNAGGDKAALVTANPMTATEIITEVPDFGKSFPKVARVTNDQLTYISGIHDAKMVTINLDNDQVKEVALPGNISRVSAGQWFKGRFYLLVDKGQKNGGHIAALRPDNTLAWSTLLPNTRPGNTGYSLHRGFDVTDHGVVFTWSNQSSGVPKTNTVLHYHTFIYALDLKGKLLWSRAVGPLEHKYLSNFALWLPDGRVLTGGRVWRPGYSRLYQGFMAVFDNKGELVPWNKAWPKP